MLSENYRIKCEKAGFDHALDFDELLQLFKSIYPHDTDYQLVSKIRIDVGKLTYCEKYCNTLSMYEIYLLAYMYRKHKREWNTRKGNFR